MPSQPASPTNPAPATPTPPPGSVVWGGRLVALEGLIAVAVAVVLVARVFTGHDQSEASGAGTAAWFVILGGGVLAAGIALIRGHRWGRAVAILAQLLLLPVVWSLLTDSHQIAYGIASGIIVVGAIGCLFAPATNTWMARGYDE